MGYAWYAMDYLCDQITARTGLLYLEPMTAITRKRAAESHINQQYHLTCDIECVTYTQERRVSAGKVSARVFIDPSPRHERGSTRAPKEREACSEHLRTYTSTWRERSGSAIVYVNVFYSSPSGVLNIWHELSAGSPSR